MCLAIRPAGDLLVDAVMCGGPPRLALPTRDMGDVADQFGPRLVGIEIARHHVRHARHGLAGNVGGVAVRFGLHCNKIQFADQLAHQAVVEPFPEAVQLGGEG
jgi:hypothetical protein